MLAACVFVLAPCAAWQIQPIRVLTSRSAQLSHGGLACPVVSFVTISVNGQPSVGQGAGPVWVLGYKIT